MIRPDGGASGSWKRIDRAEAARLLMLGAAVGAWLLVLALPLLRGAVYRADDLAGFHLPLRIFAAQTWRAGGDPSWCPDLFLGFDLHGEGQVGLAHPAHWLLYQHLTITAAFGLEVLAPLPLAMLGAMLFLRRHRLPLSTAGLGACTFGFGGFFVGHHVHPNATAVAAHLPWLLLAIERGLRAGPGGARRLAVAAGALVVGSMALLGHPQILLYASMTAFSYGMVAAGRGPLTTRLGLLCAIFGLGAMVGAAQLLPTRDAIDTSYRGDVDPEFSGLFSLHPLNLHQAFVPLLYRPRVVAPALPLAGFVTPAGTNLAHAHAREFALYSGAIVPVSIAWLIARRRRLGDRRRLAAWCAGAMVVALLLAFGAYTPLFSITSRAPGLNLFRAPARFVLVAQLAAACLVAIAATDAIEASRSGERQRLRALFVPLLIGFGLASIWPAMATRRPETLVPEALGRPIDAATSLAVLLAVTLAFAGMARGLAAAGPCLIGLTLLDLGGHALGHFRVELPERPEALIAAHRPPPLGPLERIDVQPPANNLWIGRGRGLVGGYAALFPSSRLDDRDPAARRLAGVRWTIGASVTEHADPLPFARMVSEAKVESGDPRADLAAIDPERAALVDRPAPLEPGEPGLARVVRADPGRTSIRVETPTRQLLVVADRFHPGWSARVDGDPRTVRRVNADFLGCVVPAGSHLVEFRFEPIGHRLGARWSGLGLLITGAVALSGLLRGRREGRTPCGSPGTPIAITRASAAPRPTAARSSGTSSRAATRSTS